MSKNKKAPEIISDAFLVEHLQKNTPLIIAEIRRWRYILWDDYIENKQRLEREQGLLHP